MTRRVDIVVELDVEIPLRDGVVTRADVYRPADGSLVPAVLVRTPYDKTALRRTAFHGIDPIRTARAGIACVFQDVRGRYASDGAFEPYVHEKDDGFDSIEWVASRPWCTGRIGMTGASYSGFTQLLAAATRPPSLRAIVPMVVGARPDEGWTYQGGATSLGFLLTWALTNLAPDLVTRAIADGRLDRDAWERLLDDVDDLPATFAGGARQALPALKEVGADFLTEWLAHPSDDPYWDAVRVDQCWDDIDVPALHVGGWFDPFLGGTIANYRALHARHGNQRVVVGPWTHGSWSDHVPTVSFGARAERDAVDLDGLQLRHFAEHLLDRPDPSPAATVFVLGRNRWRTVPQWPSPTELVDWFPIDAGRLVRTAATSATVRLHHDPDDPSPTLGGPTFLPGADVADQAGPRDHRVLTARPDVLLHTCDPLDASLLVEGEVHAIVAAHCAAPAFDLVVRLLDQHPDGRLMLLAEGIARTSGGRDLQLVDVTVGWLCAELPRGHRLALAITSASFPRFDVACDRPVDITVHYGADATRLRLPLTS